MRACHSFLFLGLLGGAVWAGVVGPAWIRDYPGASQSQHNQAGDCYLDTTTHDLIVVGRGELASCPGSSDLLVAKYRSNGALAWVNGFGGTQHANTDMAQAVAVDSVGNIYVAGMVANLGANDFDAAWAKYDSSGNELWRRASLWTGDDAAYGIAIGKAGDVYVCGFDNGNVELDGYLVARIDPANGDTIWKRSYILDTNALARPPRDIHPGFFTQYSEWDNCATAVAASPDSGIVVTGFGLHENREREWWTMKFTPSGVRSWAAVYRNPSTVSHDDDAAFDLAVARNGDVYVVGFDFYESGSNVEGYNYAVVRYSATGSRLNYRSVNVAAEDGDDYAFSVALDDSNPQNVYVTGVLAYPAPLNEQISTQKLSSTLTPRWGTAGAVYGDADQDHGYSICYRKDRVYVTGMNVRDPVVLGYTAANATNKQPLWTYRYDSAGDWDFGACVSAADSDHVFVAGEVYRNTVPPRSSIITARFRYGNPDLAVSAILAPRGEYYHYDTAIPRAVIVNHGNVTPNFNAFMYIGLPYGDTVEVRRPLEPGDSVILTFGSWPAHPTGLVPMRCSLETPGDTNVSNDFRSDTVRVLPIDVGCRRIISPVSPVESGTTVLPVARYRNYDSTAHTFPVWFRIEARRWWERTPVLDADGGRGLLSSTGPRFQVYEDSTTITLGALESTEVSFRLWQASPPDTYLMQAFSAMYGDDRPENDTARAQLVVAGETHDVGVARIIAPSDTVDTGDTVIPAALVSNYGNRTETFSVCFTVAALYADTVPLTLDPGQSDTVQFQAWIAGPPGAYTMRCSTLLAGDMVPANDAAQKNLIILPMQGVESPENLALIPLTYALGSPRPNPFADQVLLPYALPVRSPVSLRVYDASGALVRNLTSTEMRPGFHKVAWNGNDEHGSRVLPGAYFCRLNTPGFTRVVKVIVSK